MRPGDHPDFFRFAPPPGASRESTIALDAEGRFSHDGAPIEHPMLEKALRSWVSRHPDTGRPILTNGYDWCYFAVEGTPLFVDGLTFEREPSGPDGAGPVARAWLTLFDGTRAPLDPARLRVRADGRVVGHVPSRGLDALFSRHAQTDLGELLVEADPPTLELAGVRHVLAVSTEGSSDGARDGSSDGSRDGSSDGARDVSSDGEPRG